MAPTAPTLNRQPAQQGQRPANVAPIPFPRAARRKSIQAASATVTVGNAAVLPLAPIVLPPAGYLIDLEIYVQIATTGNGAVVAVAAGTDIPWTIFNSIQVTNAAGDTIYVPINGMDLYNINKYSGIYQAPNCDPRRDPAFVPLTTGAGVDHQGLCDRSLR